MFPLYKNLMQLYIYKKNPGISKGFAREIVLMIV